MSYNSKQYSFAKVTVVVGGKDLKTIRGVKYVRKKEKEAVYGKGSNPVAIQHGNASYEGEIQLLQSELLSLQQSAPDGSILEMTVDVTVQYGNPPGAVVTDRIEGVEFTEEAKELKQGQKFMEITLPFIALNVANNI